MKPMTITLLAMFAAGCQATVPLASPTPAPIVSESPSPAPVRSTPTATAPAGLLVAIRAANHPTFDRLVFEFGADKAPECHYEFVDAVTEDPSDRPVPLRGKAFLQLVCQDAFLDTAPREADPTKSQRYTGPKRVTPDLVMLKEVAVSGDFEAVLSFGVGLDAKTTVRVQTLTSPARLVLDFQH